MAEKSIERKEDKTARTVTVLRHNIDWEDPSDLGSITGKRALSLGDEFLRGSWYLNPRYTVHSPVPSAEFYQKARKARSSWLRTARQVLGNYGQRCLSRQVEREGRQAAILSVMESTGGRVATRQELDSVRLSNLSRIHRSEVIEAGHLANQLAFSGILYIDGQPVPPRAWQAEPDPMTKKRSG